ERDRPGDDALVERERVSVQRLADAASLFDIGASGASTGYSQRVCTTLASVIWRSLVTSVNPSMRAVAVMTRSNGSRWGSPTTTASAAIRASVGSTVNFSATASSAAPAFGFSK